MRRGYRASRYLDKLAAAREAIEDLAVTTDIIVGFPGERDEHVDYLEEWIGRAELDRVGFFEYSREDGTPAAQLGAQVPARERRRRLVRLREAQRLASERARAKRIGRVERVLIEGPQTLRRSDPLRALLGVNEATAGRSQGEAPGVDGSVFLSGSYEPGSFVDVELRGATAFDFYGVEAKVAALR